MPKSPSRNGRRRETVPTTSPRGSGSVMPTTQKAKPTDGRIMYIEDKSNGLVGPARIGRVTFSKTGRNIYYQDRIFHRFKGFKANYYDLKTGDHFWISGPKRNGGDTLYVSNTPI